MPDFWRDSGYHLLAPTDAGQMAVTDDYLRAFLRRPELAPVEESCDRERALHARLMDAPAQVIPPETLTALADPDAIDNYRLFLAFRDRLVAAGSLEAAYLGFFTAGAITIPPLFLDQMAHAILRHILDGAEDPMRARAAELLFRSHKVTIDDGTIMAADEEIVEMYARTGGFGSLGQLIVEAQTPVASVELDVLTEENAGLYWDRDTRHDTVLDISFARPGLDALCRVLEAWISHFLAVEVVIQPVQKIADERWVWHIGLDAEGTALLNDLYNGSEVEQDRLARLLSLFRMEFRNPSEMRSDIAGRPVYLAMAMTPTNVVRLKPQNLLVNLPIAERA